MEVASLGLGMKTDQVDSGTASLTAFAKSASAADKAAQKLVSTADEAGKSSEVFSARVKRNIEALEFQAAQMSRSSAEQERYTALRRAGVTAESAAGAAVLKNVDAIQQQRAAQREATEAALRATAAAKGAQQTAAESARVAQQQAAGYAALARQSEQAAAEQARLQQQQAATVNGIVAGLEHERAQLTRTSMEQAQYNALRRAGVSSASAEGKTIMATVAALENEREALRNVQAARLAASKAAAMPAMASGLSAQQKLILGYQFNDIFTQLAGGSNPAMIAAQQGPQITQIFGGLRNTIAAIPKPLLIGGGAAVGAAIAAAVLHDLAKMNDTLQEQQRRFATLLGSQTEAAKAYRDIAGFASDAGIGMESATEKFVAFARAGQALGATRKNITDIASTTEKLSQLSGASPAEGTATQGALADMLKDSTVNADQLKTVLGNVPQIADKIAAGLGVSVTQLRLMAAEGELSNRQVFDAILKQTAAVNAEFAKMPKSIGATFTSIGDDLGQLTIRLAGYVPAVQSYRLAIEGIAIAAKKLNEATAPATPQQRMAAAGGPSVYSDASNRLFRGGANPSAFYGAQFDQGVSDNSATFAAMAAQSNAAKEAVVSAAAIADKLDPMGKQFRDSAKEIVEMEKALDFLQSGLSGLTTTEAAAQVDRLTSALGRARVAAAAIDPALKALEDIRLRSGDQARFGNTDAQTAYGARVRELSGGDQAREQNAIMAAQAEQQEALNKLVKGKQDELAAEEKITAATGKTRQALIEAQTAAAKLNFEMTHVGVATEASAKAAQDFADAYAKILQQQFLQQQLTAVKSLKDEYDGVVAAQQALVDGHGAFSQRRAQAQVKADRDPMGTGQEQLQLFDQQQWYADAVMLDNLRKQVELTNKLAAAAGDVAKQKQIQLDFDIKQAQQNAHPAAAEEIDKQMRGKAAADSGRAYAEIIAQGKEYVAQQEIEQQAVFMSAEAADRLRFAHQLLNQVKQAGIEQTPAVIEGIRRTAEEMAAATQNVRDAREIYDLAKSSFQGFLGDLRQGVADGKNFWDSFGNAASNALDRIASKLLDMATQKLFESAFGGAPGTSGAGGGFLGSLFGSLFGSGGGGVTSSAIGGPDGFGGLGGALPVGWAAGGVFNRGNVIPFARGGIVDRPTLFPFAKGTGLMGEAGPEAIMPLRRGRNGSLGVQMHGGGAQQQPVVVYVTGDTDLVRVTSHQEAVKVVTAASPKIEASAVNKSTRAAPSAVATDHAERGGDYRT